MKVTPSALPDVLIIEPQVFEDERGFFCEIYNEREFEQATGLQPRFVQDNLSRSAMSVLRGLHYQIRQPQGKLVGVLSGEVFDVVVDLRKNSSAFGKWMGTTLSADNKRMIWIPEGFAHGFLVLSKSADFFYKSTDFYVPKHERCVIWNDPDIGIVWPWQSKVVLSAKDQAGKHLSEAEVF